MIDNTRSGNPAFLHIDGRPIVFAEPIEEKQFDDLETFGRLADIQGLQIIIVTRAAWSKYESLLFTPEELNKMLGDIDG